MTPEMMQAALRDALAEARHGDREPLRRTLEYGMRAHLESFVHDFLTRMLAMSHDLMSEAWTERSRELLKARVVRLAHDLAMNYGIDPDAADAVACYALSTMTIEGLSLDDATPERIAAQRSPLPYRGDRSDR